LRWKAAVCALTFACTPLLCPISAQTPDQPKGQKSTGSAEVMPISLSLKSAKAENVSRALKELLGVKVATESNAVLVYATASDLEKARVVVRMLEELAEGLKSKHDPNKQTRFIVLKHIEVNPQLADAIKLVFEGGDKGNFSFNPQRKQVILFCDELTYRAVLEMVQNLDQPLPIRSPQRDVQVRVVWLASGLPPESKTPPPPDDLKETLPGLAKLGIDQPRLVAQSVVTAGANSIFQTRGVAILGRMYPFSVTGQFLDEDMRKLSITIVATASPSVKATQAKGPEEICRVQTEITAPPGHILILGVTPTETGTSVFIIQVIHPEAPKTKK
jgi:hypothetical protein